MEARINILLVEDSADDAFIIREMLSETVSTACRIQWVDLASRGRQWIDQHPGAVDLVLLDLTLPDSRGMDTLLAFRRHAPAIPIVVLTGLDDEAIGRQAIKEGAQDYICKNDLSLNILENSLRFAIERHQTTSQLENKRNQLLESERRFRRIIEKNADGILILDKKGRILFSNPAAENIFAKKTDSIPGHLFRKTPAPGETIEITFVNDAGEWIFVEMESKEIRWEGKTAHLASLRNITERKQLEKSLLIEKERLDITLRSISDGVITTDKRGNIRLFNQAAEKMTGLTQIQAEGQLISQLLDIEIPTQLPEELDREFSYGTSSITVSGNEVTIDYSRAPILDKKNRLIGYGFIIRDTTLQQKMAEEMIKVQKMESLGVVAGKLAHDFDNVFTVILGNISIAKTLLEDNPRIANMLEKSEASALRAKELTGQLHTFSRVGASFQRAIPISKLIQEVVADVMENHKPPNASITCQWQIQDGLWTLQFDKDQMPVALWNIVKNAVEAMPDGGTLHISLENRVVSEKMHLPLKSGSYVKISIKDTGTGMDKEIRQKILDPFFTTKEKAMGMGLTVAFSIIRDHQGTLDVDTQIGKGSTFSVYLPSLVTPGDRKGTEETRKKK